MLLEYIYISDSQIRTLDFQYVDRKEWFQDLNDIKCVIQPSRHIHINGSEQLSL